MAAQMRLFPQQRPRKTPSRQELLALVPRVHPKCKPVWDGMSQDDQIALAGYFLPRRSEKEFIEPTRPKVVKWYCPFASQCNFPSGHRYCINVYVGCSHNCRYCYAAAYEPEKAATKRDFRRGIDRDMAELNAFDVPPAPVHLSNSVDAFQPLERSAGHARYALEQILAYRNRFTTVTVLTKNPTLPIEMGYLDLFKELMALPRHHPLRADFHAQDAPAFQVHVSLAFWNDESRAAYDPDAPTVDERREGILRLREAGIPLVLRIDPLFPRSPLPTHPSQTLQDFGLVEAQTIEDLENLVQFARRAGVRHVVYSALKIVQPRRRKLDDTMKAMQRVYKALAAPEKPDWHGGSWRLPRALANKYILRDFLKVCRREGVKAKFCAEDLVETP